MRWMLLYYLRPPLLMAWSEKVRYYLNPQSYVWPGAGGDGCVLSAMVVHNGNCEATAKTYSDTMP